MKGNGKSYVMHNKDDVGELARATRDEEQVLWGGWTEMMVMTVKWLWELNESERNLYSMRSLF